jgi:hypothetical protein
MPEENAVVAVEEAPVVAVESPPAAGAPERRAFDPRARLHELAVELVRTQNRRLLVEYLRLRRVRG